jgi:hypothetical protein
LSDDGKIENAHVPDRFLKRLVVQYQTDETVAVVLSGSFARGDATPFSDVDLIFYMTTAEACVPDYELHYEHSYLISLSRSTIGQKWSEMQTPSSAIWAVEGIRQSQILHDPSGNFTALQQSAKQFRWEPLQPKANQYAGEHLRGLIEEVHKVLTGLHKQDESTLAIAILGLILSLPRIIAVQRGLLMITENEFVDRVLESTGHVSAWARHYRIAAAMDFHTTGANIIFKRATAVLQLYVETVRLLRSGLHAEDIRVIDQAVNIIHTAEFDWIDRQ